MVVRDPEAQARAAVDRPLSKLDDEEGRAAGLYGSPEAFRALAASPDRFSPSMAPAERDRLNHGWRDSVSRTLAAHRRSTD